VRVAHIIDNVALGGAQKSVVLLSEVIQDYDAELVILSLYESKSLTFEGELRKNGAVLKYFPGKKLLNLRRIISLTKYLRREKFDLVHTHLTYGNIVGVIVARLAGIPVMAMSHSSGIDPRIYHPIRHRLETWLLRFAADMVTGDSYSAAEALRTRMNGKLVYPVPNAVPVPDQIPHQDAFAVKKELVGDKDRLIIIAVGRLSAPKGYSDLIDAFNIVHMRKPEALLLIVGKGNLKEQLVSQIATLGLSEYVILAGSRDDVPALLAASDIYVSSSHWEGLSLALLEAMINGLPVVATDVGDAKRVVPENSGIIVPPHHPEKLAAALLALLDDQEKRKKYGQNAREHAIRNHGPKPWADLLFSLYAQILSEAKMGSRFQLATNE